MFSTSPAVSPRPWNRKNGARVHRARPCGHAEAVQRCKAQASVDAPPMPQGAQAGAAAQVRDDHAAVRNLGRNVRENGRDVLVGEAVKPVTFYPAAADLTGQGDQPRDSGLAAGESWCRSTPPAPRP